MVIQITRRNLFILLSILVVLIAVPLTLYLSQRQQETRSHASTPNPVVATVAGNQITQSDVLKIALEDSDQTSINADPENLATAKDTAIERAILDSVSQDEGITADQSEIDQVVSDEDISSTEAKYEVLRNKIITEKVRYAKALSIGYWEPTVDQKANYSDSDWATVQQQEADGAKAMDSAARSLASSDDAVGITSDLIKTYPSLSGVLAMNGLIFSKMDPSDQVDSATPALYEYGDSNFDPETRDKVFATTNKVGDIIPVSNTSANGGGTVFKITEIGAGTEDSYDSWLAKEKASIVK